MLHIKAELQLCQVLRPLHFHSKILQQYLGFWFCMDSGCDLLRFLSSDQLIRALSLCGLRPQGLIRLSCPQLIQLSATCSISNKLTVRQNSALNTLSNNQNFST